LRQDDADDRLTLKGYELGLAKTNRLEQHSKKTEERENLLNFVKNYSVKPAFVNEFLISKGSAELKHGCKLSDLILRPQVTINELAEVVPSLKRKIESISEIREEIVESAEIILKYSGYIEREKIIADKLHRLERISIKDRFEYSTIQSLSTEARQKLTKINPETIGQASRIPGVSPSDINILLVLLGR
jgi:tRNA uridine 5-carboxymethylaminomethyl modification enzyme